MVRFLEDVMDLAVEFLDTIYNRSLRLYCRIFGHDWYGVDCLRCSEYLDKCRIFGHDWYDGIDCQRCGESLDEY